MPLPANYNSPLNVNKRRNNDKVAYSVVGKSTFLNPLALNTALFSASHLGSAVVGTRNMVLAATAPDVPRNVVITVTHASSVVAMSGVITGLDRNNQVITEAWSVTATGTTKTFTGNKAFSAILSISETVAADASGNSIVAGTGIKLGLAVKASAPAVVAELMDGATTTAGTIVAGAGPGSAAADEFGTYTPNTTPNGVHRYDVWHVSDDPWNS